MHPRLPALVVGIFLSLAGLALAQTNIIENSGFAPGNLWFSKAPTTVGETVRVYSLVWNASKDDISGTVSFFDNDILIGKQPFILAGEGSSKILSVPWAVSAGYHKIYAQITDSLGGPRGTKAVSVSLQYGKSEEEEQFVGAPAPAGAGATTTATNFVGQKLDYTKGYAEANLPKPVVEATKAGANLAEEARAAGKAWSEKIMAGLQKDLNLAAGGKKGGGQPAGESGFSIERPLEYVALFLLSVLSFILGNVWIFYGLAAVIAFWFLRFIKRKFFF